MSKTTQNLKSKNIMMLMIVDNIKVNDFSSSLLHKNEIMLFSREINLAKPQLE